MIKIGDYNFEGPYIGTYSLLERSGLYAILDILNNDITIIDIGESSSVKTRIESHDRREQWNRTAQGKIMIAVLYLPYQDQSSRMEIERQLRSIYQPACGER